MPAAVDNSAPPASWGVLIAHPSRRPEAQDAWADFRRWLGGERPGYLLWELQSPLDPVLEHAAKAPPGATFSVVPLLLAPGSHFTEDTQGVAKVVARAEAHLDVVIRPPLLADEAFLSYLLERL